MLLDRANPLFPSDYAFRDIYLLASAAENGDSVVYGALHGLNGWIACFEKSRLAGGLRSICITEPGDIRKRPDIIEQAFKMGNSA